MASYADLMAAVNGGEGEKVRTLLEENSAVASQRAGAESVVLAAMYRGRQDLVAMLRPHVQLDLFEASALGEIALVMELVKKDRQLVRQYSSDGWTALHLAAFMGHRQTAEALLELGAELTAISKNSIANQPLHAALAGKTDRQLVEMLIERGADVNSRGAGGVTPLHLAASRGDAALCDLLNSKGADPSAKMDDGTTPDAIAAKRGHAEVAEQLRSHLR